MSGEDRDLLQRAAHFLVDVFNWTAIRWRAKRRARRSLPILT